MKIRLICFFVFLVAIGGCSKIKDAATISVATHLQTDIPVVVTSVGMKSINMISVSNSIVFTKTQDLTLSNNVDIAPYLDKVKSINLNSVVVTISGLTTGQTINSVSFDVAGVGNIFTQSNITMANNTFIPSISSGLLDQIALKLTSDRKISITVSGNTSGPMIFSVGLNIDSTVIVYALK